MNIELALRYRHFIDEKVRRAGMLPRCSRSCFRVSRRHRLQKPREAALVGLLIFLLSLSKELGRLVLLLGFGECQE